MAVILAYLKIEFTQRKWAEHQKNFVSIILVLGPFS